MCVFIGMSTFIQNLSQHTISVTSICNRVKHYTVIVVWSKVRISQSLGYMQYTVLSVGKLPKIMSHISAGMQVH